MTDPDYGTDVSTYVVNEEGEADLDPYFAEIEGERVVAEAFVRRLETPKGQMFWDPNAGRGVRRLISKRLTTAALLEERSALNIEAEKDERVFAADIDLEPSRDTELAITGDITTANGTFELVANIGDVTVELLAPQA